MNHDQNYKNLILDYPREAIAFFAASEAHAIDSGARIIPVREEQLKQRLGDAQCHTARATSREPATETQACGDTRANGKAGTRNGQSAGAIPNGGANRRRRLVVSDRCQRLTKKLPQLAQILPSQRAQAAADLLRRKAK
jgi:hypothetical protein